MKNIVTVGFGTEGGATIPMHSAVGITQKVDEAGQVVITKYEPTLLREVAAAAGGEFIAASETDKGARIHNALARLDTKQPRHRRGSLSRPLRTAWFLLPALILLLMDSWFADGGRFDDIRRKLRFAVPLALLAVIGGTTGAQSTLDPMELFKAGLYDRAAQRWKDQIANGDKHPSTLYNYGTAMLAARSRSTLPRWGTPSVRPPYPMPPCASVPSTTSDSRSSSAACGRTLRIRARLARRRPRTARCSGSRPAMRTPSGTTRLALRLQKQQKGGGGSNNDNNSQPQQGQAKKSKRREQVDVAAAGGADAGRRIAR